MKGTRRRSLACGLLAAALLLSFAACGENPGATPSSGTEPSVSGGGASSGPEAGPWIKYDDPITITRAQQVSASSQWPEGDSVSENMWTRDALDTLNIRLEDMWQVDVTQYEEKINMGIASNNLPDVFAATNKQLRQLAKSGMAFDMTAIYEENASEGLRDYMDADPVGFESGLMDGKLVGLSQQSFGIVGSMSTLWIRQDWLRSVGGEMPATFAELEALMDKFAHGDPDANGSNDTYGMGVSNSLSQLYQLMSAFHAYPGLWVRDAGGAVVFGGIQPEVKEAVKAFRRWYENGLLSPDFAIMDSSKLTEDIVSGKVGMTVQQTWFGYGTGTDLINRSGEDAVFLPALIPSNDEQFAKPGVNWPVVYYTVVNKSCAHPEAVVRLLNLYVERTVNDPEHFSQGDVYWGSSPCIVNNTRNDHIGYGIMEAVEKRDPSDLNPTQLTFYDGVMQWLDNKNADMIGVYTQIGPKGAYGLLLPVVDRNDYVMTAYRGTDSPTMTQKWSTLEAMYAETLTKLIMTGDIDAGFDELAANWNALGGETITQEMNEMLG